ncbi:hypothetical protein DMB38_11255 [Streptomyces sp. WAC 06738]|uniref:hypothetical protein n=1 Tax=Streptomyces sp. WAC 06738 TaxID=2203210 RepID=UPI000F71E65E|nr:hypothetical protein [Streptomyces sp. WAC 06738]AZM46320.1 hypothetical protein DMB38_11255 [Streptomyces sp. WAC 06738]
MPAETSMSGDEFVMPALAAAFDDRDAGKALAALGELLDTPAPGGRPALWHPLGCFRLDLAGAASRRRYALHCWPRGERHPAARTLTVHRHAYALESLVIDGELRYRRFGGAPGGVRGPLYRAEGGGRLSVLKRTEEVAELEVVEDRLLGPGRFYAASAADFHESRVAEAGFCVTLTRTSPKLRPGAHALGEFTTPPVLLYRRRPVAEPLLTRLRDHIGRQ